MALPPLVEEIADALFKHFFGVEARKHFGARSSPLKRARRGRRHRIRSRRSRASNALATAPGLRGGTDIRCSHALLLPFETRAARAKSSNSLSTQSRVKRTRYRNTTTGGNDMRCRVPIGRWRLNTFGGSFILFFFSAASGACGR